MKINYKCLICEKIFDSTDVKSLTAHLQFGHKIKSKEYYDKYLKEDENNCPICNNKTSYIDIKSGYREFCSNKCSNINKWKNPVYREKIENNIKNFSKCEIYRENLRKRAIEQHKNPEHKKLISENSKKNWKNPELRDRMIQKGIVTRKIKFEDEECKSKWEIKVGRGLCGKFLSCGTFFASSYEAIFYYKEKYLNNRNLIRCPGKLSIYYSTLKGDRTYFPDYLDIDNKIIYEIKAKGRIDINYSNCCEKIYAATQIYPTMGYKYELITEDYLFKTVEDKKLFKHLINSNIIKLSNENKKKD